MPFAFLTVKGHGHLVQVTVHTLNMRVCVLSGTNNIIHFFHPLKKRILCMQAVLFKVKRIVLPESLITEIAIGIAKVAVFKTCSRFLPGSIVERLSHSGSYKAIVDVLMTKPAGMNACVAGCVAVVKIKQTVFFYFMV